MDKCHICGRALSSVQFCEYHEAAFANLKESFEKWKTANKVTWSEYLDQVIQLENTGRWVVEVIDFLKKQDDS